MDALAGRVDGSLQHYLTIRGICSITSLHMTDFVTYAHLFCTIVLCHAPLIVPLISISHFSIGNQTILVIGNSYDKNANHMVVFGIRVINHKYLLKLH